MNQNLLNIATAGPALFIVTAFIFGLVKPKYSALHNTISELALGRYGYVQTANFTLSGLLIVLLGLRLAAMGHYRYGAVTVVIMGLVLMLSAVFRTDPVAANGSTTTGKIHNGLFFIGMLSIVSGQFVTGLSNLGTGLGAFSLACGALALLSTVVTVTRQAYMGVFQRILVVIIMAWIAGFGMSVLGW
jgi:hypothetical membrane protein